MGEKGMRGGAGVPHEGDFFGGEAVNFVHQVGELALELERFGGLGVGRFDGADVLVAKALEGGDGKGILRRM